MAGQDTSGVGMQAGRLLPRLDQAAFAAAPDPGAPSASQPSARKEKGQGGMNGKAAIGTIAPPSSRTVERTLAAIMPLFSALDYAAADVWACLDARRVDIAPAAHLGRIFG